MLDDQNRAKVVTKLLQRFASSEGLFRGTALSANVVMTAMVAQIAGFGPDGVLLSAAVHLGLGGLLELPTGLLADRVGTHHAVSWGLSLKFLTTLSFLAATYFALNGAMGLAVTWLSVEALLDALANALISGSYQASYLNWYRAQLRQVSVEPQTAPSLFLASFRYAIKLRLGLPVAFIACASLEMILADRLEVGRYALLLPVASLMVLRVITLWKVRRDLDPEGVAILPESKSKRRPIGEMISACLKVARGSGRTVFALNVIGSFLSAMAMMFLVGKSMQMLKVVGLGSVASWAGGAGLGLVIHGVVIYGSRYVYPRLSRGGISSLKIVGIATLAVSSAVCAVSLLSAPAWLLTLTTALASVALMLLGGGIQRWAESNIPGELPDNTTATWLSLVQSVSLSLFGLASGSIVATGMESLGLPFFSAVAAFAGFSVVMIASPESGRLTTLRQFLTIRIIFPVILLCFVGVAWDARSTYSILTQSAVEKEQTYLSLAVATLKEPLLQGGIVETKRRMATLAREMGAYCLGVKAEGLQLGECDSKKQPLGAGVYTGEIRFSSDSDKAFGTVTVIFDRSEIEAVVRHRVLASFLALLAISMAALMFLRAMARRIVDEFDAVQKINTKSPTLPASFRIAEAHNIAESLTSAIRESMEANTARAVAQMTGMLAHDVRKPFSILRMGLAMLGNAKDPASVKRVLGRLIPEIDRAVSSVDGLIIDVMEIGSTSTQLILEPISPKVLVAEALAEVFRVYPKSDISITYAFNHTSSVSVHVQKVARVFSNILGNAVQAMGGKGEMWLRAEQKGDVIQFCLGNTGSYIAKASVPHLFDAFYTSGKKGGTGLGLAIAQKIITAHGGRIWCESLENQAYPSGKVEFFFTLPVAESTVDTASVCLPSHSSSIVSQFKSDCGGNDTSDKSPDKGELALEADIIQASRALQRCLRVLVVDDEAVYCNALSTYLSRVHELAGALEIVEVDSSQAALKVADGNSYDLIITDVDMGLESTDGFDLVHDLRAQGVNALICVHSNRIVAADHKAAMAVGADAFMPKPMGRAQLLRLLLQSVEVRSNYAR